MKNTKLIRFAQSLVLLPALTVSMPSGMPKNFPETAVNTHPQVILSQKDTISSFLSLNKGEDAAAGAEEAQEALFALQAKAIDTYFADRDMPLAGAGLKMAQEAVKNGLDWRLVAAIAVRESTGGKHDCQKVTFNAFGWGSCKIGFKSNDLAIETVARNLGGNNPNTAYHYDNKTTIQILRAYNPPSVVPKYAEQVISIMNAIGPEDITIPSNVSA